MKSKHILPKIALATTLLSSPLLFNVSGHVQVEASTITFQDINKEHYAYDAIIWAKNNGIISGYTDKYGLPTGKFGPSNEVTEAQFVKMITNYLQLHESADQLTKTSKTAHWSDPHYNAIAQFSAPLNGYFDNAIRNTAVKRGTVAQVIGSLLGEENTLEGSVEFMLQNKLTTGQNQMFEGKDVAKFFGSTNHLTRAQVVTFLYRIEMNDLNQLHSPTDLSNPSSDLSVKAKQGFSQLDKSLAVSAPSVVVDKETNMTTTTFSNGLILTTSTSVIDQLPKDENGKPYIFTMSRLAKEIVQKDETYQASEPNVETDFLIVKKRGKQENLFALYEYNGPHYPSIEIEWPTDIPPHFDQILSVQYDEFMNNRERYIDYLYELGFTDNSLSKSELNDFINRFLKTGSTGIYDQNLALYGQINRKSYVNIMHIID